MEYSALIVAAGSGTRMNLGFNKVYAKLKDGRSIIETTYSAFMEDPDCVQIVIVTDSAEFRRKIQGRHSGKITLAQGGETRQQSVFNGLHCVLAEHVMIHDGARPYIDQASLDRLKEALATDDAALLTVPCKDTIKKVVDGYVVETYDRSTLAAAQTPQAFRTSLIIDCMEKAVLDGFTGTDDASLVERYSDTKVRAVEGSYVNFKITTPEDLKG